MFNKIVFGSFLCFLTSLSLGQSSKQVFEFSKGKSSKSGVIFLNSIINYDEEKEGYGFDYNSGSVVNIKNNRGKKTIYSNKPFYFSTNLKEGNYKVSLYYSGLEKHKIYSTVRAESRRWVLENVEVDKKKDVVRSFIVHIKNPKIKDSLYVKLKDPRENEKLDWDNKLTIEFQGENSIEKIVIEPVDNITTIFLAGNSTVTNQEDEPWASWGQMITRYFDTNIVIANHAESGLALSSFLSSNRLEKILSLAKPGDYLFIEFGHNDQKEKGEKAGAYNGYAERLRFYVERFRNIGGNPVIITSTARRSFDKDGNLLFTLGDYPIAARMVAQQLDVPLIDLNQMTRDMYIALGVEDSKNALVHYPADTFPNQKQSLQDNTHFNTYGAGQIAKMVLKGIKLENLPIATHIIDFLDYNPSKPDNFNTWKWPLSLKSSPLKPDGN